MEVELKNIIEKIKEEGIGEAEKKASDITKDAETKAESIIKEAQDKKEIILKEAAEASEALKKNGAAAVKQASRDAMLSLREQITALFDSVGKQKIAEQLTPDVLKNMIVTLAEKFKREKLDVEVLLSEKDKKALEKELFKALKEDIKKGIVVKVSPRVENGFRIGAKGESFYYDFTDEAIAEAFTAFLNPKIMEILTPDKK